MEESIGDMVRMLFREYVDLSNKQRNMARELREIKEEMALLKSAEENRKDPCRIFFMNGVTPGRLSDKT